MTLRNAAFFAIIGMALWTILMAANFRRNVSGVTGGFLPAMSLITSLIEFVAVLSLLIFFVVFHKSQS
jgi:hypothetical protein